MKFTVGLTGGIGSGKSFVTELFAEMGVYIIDADTIAHELSTPPSKALDEIRQLFGAEYLDHEGTLDRVKIREHIFNGTNTQQTLARKKLEAIFHPLVRSRILDLLQHEAISSPYIILSIPLLFETNDYGSIIHRSLVVDCPVSMQITRTIQRGLSETVVKEIIASQMPRETRLAKADDVIDNSTNQLSDVKKQVFALHQRYLQLSVIKR